MTSPLLSALVEGIDRALPDAAALRRAIALQPMDPVAYANLAFLYLEQDRPDEAKRLIDRALALDPAFDVALFARGRWNLQRGDITAARDDLLQQVHVQFTAGMQRDAMTVAMQDIVQRIA